MNSVTEINLFFTHIMSSEKTTSQLLNQFSVCGCKALIFTVLCLLASVNARAQKAVEKLRILISTDIGGTDPDDNQSFAHLMMYSDTFQIEGLVSSPSYGEGSAKEMLRMIDIFEKDYPHLSAHYPGLLTPKELRALCKQGRKGEASYKGYDTPTEGSNWIVTCAKRESDRPLWVLVWGGLEDVAQALHDAPEIASRIKVHWIGGPNKKWSVNSYMYIMQNFPQLWFIEDNAAYRGFISERKVNDEYNAGYYDKHIRGAGHLGADFINYYGGLVKMGDTPSLLYMMNGDPDDPMGESWGGSFEPMTFSPHTIFYRNTTEQDTIAIYSILELRFKAPACGAEVGEPCLTLTTDKQQWRGVYLGNGEYVVRYCPKKPGLHEYTISSDRVKELDGQSGAFVAGKEWPGKRTADSHQLGNTWYTDKGDPALFHGEWQGVETVYKYRKAVLDDWACRWNCLKPHFDCQ